MSRGDNPRSALLKTLKAPGDVKAVEKRKRHNRETYFTKPDSKRIARALEYRARSLLIAQCEGAAHVGHRAISVRLRVTWKLLIGGEFANPALTVSRLHPDTGLPFIPSTAIKYLLRAGARLKGSIPGDRERILGKVPRRGSVTVFDAHPDHSLRVIAHHVTVHRPLSEVLAGERLVPLEAKSPNPILWIAVAFPSEFEFPLVGPGADVALAKEWLVLGAAEIGVGKATRRGLGRLHEANP